MDEQREGPQLQRAEEQRPAILSRTRHIRATQDMRAETGDAQEQVKNFVLNA